MSMVFEKKLNIFASLNLIWIFGAFKKVNERENKVWWVGYFIDFFVFKDLPDVWVADSPDRYEILTEVLKHNAVRLVLQSGVVAGMSGRQAEKADCVVDWLKNKQKMSFKREGFIWKIERGEWLKIQGFNSISKSGGWLVN